LKQSLRAVAFGVLAASFPVKTTSAGQTPPPASTLHEAQPESGTTTRIGGIEMRCQDFRGREVTTIKVDELGDVGRAWVINTMPFIVLDPQLLRLLPYKLQNFFYAHECAHHVLGHWYNPSPENEKEADCWAIRYGRDTGLFTRQEVANFAPWLAESKGSRFGHLPGPIRARHLLDCFDSSPPLILSKEQENSSEQKAGFDR